MKIYLTIMLVTLLSMEIVVSCKKNNPSLPSPPSKDYTPSIKGKTWWGMFTNNGYKSEYYSVHFKPDNTLIWSQLLGDFDGQWSVNGNQLTVNLRLGEIEIKANINDDNKLENITDNVNTSTINSGQLVADPGIQLDNTVWRGVMSNIGDFRMSFMPGLKVTTESGIYFPGPETYTRTVGGGVLRIAARSGLKYFGIVVSGSEMKGCYSTSYYSWQVTKQ